MTPQERDRVQKMLVAARRSGRDPLQVLDEHALLFTSRLYRDIRRSAMEEVAQTLELAKIMSVLKRYGRSDNTALDAQQAIIAMIRDMAGREAA